MKNRIESWLLNVFVGKLVARAAVTIVAWVGSVGVQAILRQAGIQVQIDPAELTTGIIAGGHAAFEWFKARRAANPNSPAVQTDPKLIPRVIIL